VVISLKDKSSIADYMIIATGTSQRQVGAMAEHLVEKLKAAGLRTTHIEGRTQGDWVLVDAGDVVVHLFRPEIRAFYNLEKLWGRALPAAGNAVELIA
jgi:ribosome-associated protein